MADPLSIFTATLAVATAVLSSTNELVTVVRSIKDAPAEVNRVFQDVQAFHSAIVSLQNIMNSEDALKIAADDATMLGTLRGLEVPLHNCEVLIQKLLRKTKDRRYASSDTPKARVARNLKWGLFTKREVRELRASLQDARFTLNHAKSNMTMFVTS